MTIMAKNDRNLVVDGAPRGSYEPPVLTVYRFSAVDALCTSTGGTGGNEGGLDPEAALPRKRTFKLYD